MFESIVRCIEISVCEITAIVDGWMDGWMDGANEIDRQID